MRTLAAQSILPPWLVLPIAGATLIILAAHLIAMQHQAADQQGGGGGIPARRLRIRTVNGLLMMVLTALLAYAIGIARVVTTPAADPAQTRVFLMVWMLITGLVVIVLAMAGFDVLTTMRLRITDRRAMRRDMQMRTIAEARDRARRAADTPSQQDGDAGSGH